MNIFETVTSLLCITLICIPLGAICASESITCQRSLERLSRTNSNRERMRMFSEDCDNGMSTENLVLKYGQSIREYRCLETRDRMRSIELNTGSAILLYFAGNTL